GPRNACGSPRPDLRHQGYPPGLLPADVHGLGMRGWGAGMKTKATVDLKEVFAGLEKLEAIKYPLARSMAVAGGAMLRDEAKLRAPVGVDSNNPGTLRDSIYLAFRDKA